MNITDVKIKLLENNRIKAMASITINEEFVVTGLKVLEGQNGLWVSMPNRKTLDGEYKDTAFPITAQARTDIIDAVLLKYSKEAGKKQDNGFYPVEDPESELPF